jgi:hypothetical protein
LLPLVAAPAWAGAECKPAVIAAGDHTLVDKLVARLTASGIATTATAGCPSVHVQVEMRGERVHVAMTDAFDRPGEREVDDVATAAVIVESWTRQEIDVGSLPAQPGPPRHYDLGATAISALGTNGTTWVGGALSACASIGPVCTGVLVRGETDTGATGDSSTVAQSSYALTGLATIDMPWHAGGVVVEPGIGLGYGWLHVVTHHHDAMNDPLDVPSSDHRLQTGAHVALHYPIGSHVAAFGDLWGDVCIARSNAQFGPTASVRAGLGISIEVP